MFAVLTLQVVVLTLQLIEPQVNVSSAFLNLKMNRNEAGRKWSTLPKRKLITLQFGHFFGFQTWWKGSSAQSEQTPDITKDSTQQRHHMALKVFDALFFIWTIASLNGGLFMLNEDFHVPEKN